MPAGEPCRRRVDEKVERHPLTVAAPARPEPQAAVEPGQRGSSTSWVALQLAAAAERDSGRKAPLRQRPVRCCGTAVSRGAVLGWVLMGVLVAIYLLEGASLAPQTVGNDVAPPMARVADLGRPAAPKPESSPVDASTAKWGASIAAEAPRQGDGDWAGGHFNFSEYGELLAQVDRASAEERQAMQERLAQKPGPKPKTSYPDTKSTKADPGAHSEAKAVLEPGANSEAEAEARPGVHAKAKTSPFPFIRLGDTNAALFNKSVGANADGKTLAFWHIPKTGGTYVENVLSGAGIKVGRDLFEAAGDRKTVRPAMPKAFSPWHMPLPEMLEYIETSAMKWAEPPVEGNTLRWWLDLDNVDFFCVVRDPYWKLISEYKWRTSIATADDHGHKLDCSVESLNRFLAKWVPSGKHFDHHMTPQVRFIYDSNGDQVCRHILRQENLNAQLHALLLEYNLIDAAAAVPSHAEAQTTVNRDQAEALAGRNRDQPAKGALLGADAHQRGGGRGLANAQARENDMKSGDCGFDPSMLAEETKRLIRERYREDFDAFGYDDLSEDVPAASEPVDLAPAALEATGTAVPRGGWPSHSNIIWMLWAQGLDDLEAQGGKYAVDKTCVRAWKRLYPGPESGWEVRLLDDAEAKLLAPRYAAVRDHPKSEWVKMGAGASDLLRADLLSRYGGVWVDTSVCPFQALDDWLPAALDAREGLFFPRAFDDEAIEGALADMPAAAMSGSELEQFEGCLDVNGLRGPLAWPSRSMSSWVMAAATPHDSIIDAWAEILNRRLLEVFDGPEEMHPPWLMRYPYFVAHCSMTMARLSDAAVGTRWQRIRASAAEHGLPDPTGLGSTPCECALGTESGCDPDFAEAHCYFVKKAGGKDYRAYLRSPRYQEHLDRLAAAAAAAPASAAASEP